MQFTAGTDGTLMTGAFSALVPRTFQSELGMNVYLALHTHYSISNIHIISSVSLHLMLIYPDELSNYLVICKINCYGELGSIQNFKYPFCIAFLINE